MLEGVLSWRGKRSLGAARSFPPRPSLDRIASESRSQKPDRGSRETLSKSIFPYIYTYTRVYTRVHARMTYNAYSDPGSCLLPLTFFIVLSCISTRRVVFPRRDISRDADSSTLSRGSGFIECTVHRSPCRGTSVGTHTYVVGAQPLVWLAAGGKVARSASVARLRRFSIGEFVFVCAPVKLEHRGARVYMPSRRVLCKINVFHILAQNLSRARAKLENIQCHSCQLECRIK